MSDNKAENTHPENHQNNQNTSENDAKQNSVNTVKSEDKVASEIENKDPNSSDDNKENALDKKTENVIEESTKDEQIKEKSADKSLSQDKTETKKVSETEDKSTEDKTTEQQKDEVDQDKDSTKVDVKPEIKTESKVEDKPNHKIDSDEKEDSAETDAKEESKPKEKADSEEDDSEKVKSKDEVESEDEAELKDKEESKTKTVTENDDKTKQSDESESDDDEHHKEIEDANAEDSEDENNSSRHDIELEDYDAMSMDELVIELEKLLNKEKVQAIREHVTQIKIAFDKKFNEITEEKQEQFIEEGGNIIDFHYSSPVKAKFNRIYFEYREKRDAYYKNLKKNLNDNLKNRLALIEELKNMIGSGGDMKATFNQFKDLQEKWKNAGPVPRSEYSQLWKTYHHHVERFYDFLHLDREFRDLDFQHNLDQKLKIISRAEELAEEEDVNRAFRELQLLHKMWKEELGPVAKEYRDEIWDKFSDATKKIHQNRKAYFETLDKEREKNLEVKLDIIKQIEKLADTEIKSHKHAQKQIKLVQELRDIFFKAGRVPQKDNEAVWKSFKEQVRRFNRSKNAYYKNLKQQQNENLQKKLELIKIAEDNKDSDDFETITPLMKKIQADWKKIGFVPRKHSDKIWKQFKAACNYYFDRFHSHKNEENEEEFEAFKAKKDLLDKVKNHTLKGDKEEDLKAIKSYIEQWKSLGLVPKQKKYIEGKFNKALDHFFKKMNIEKTEAELLKYENRLQGLEEADDDNQLYKEEQFLRTKISDTKSKINQFENNLQFFSESDKESPLVKEVYDKIDKLKDELNMWKVKLDKIKSL